MANKVYENQKIPLRFSKKSIDNAAREIRYNCTEDERKHALEKIKNFRELHLYPLMLIKNHLARAANKVDRRIIIARRLKRLPTIIDKLERPSLDGATTNAIKLTRMQDIGGCRAIVKDISQLNALRARLKSSRSVHIISHESDYLIPKSSGYGGVHLVYSCFDKSGAENNWRKTKIEVQLRTNLQHAWATSLEIIDTLKQIKLKTSLTGHYEWRRFFSITGQLVAHDEGANILDSDTIDNYENELVTLEKNLNAIKNITDFSVGIDVATRHLKTLHKSYRSGMCLVTLTLNTLLHAKVTKDGNRKVMAKVVAFKSENLQNAIAALNEAEDDKDILISVLLSASDVTLLKKAYPNYFGSTTDFSRFVLKHIKNKRQAT